MRTLVVGGTGPTGPFVVNGLLDAGHDVTVLHTGAHELAALPSESVVPHIHTNPFDEEAFRQALEGQSFDAVIAMYGRLRMVASVLAGRVGRFISIGGTPVYSGFVEGSAMFPAGMPIPVREGSPLVGQADSRKLQAIRAAEDQVFQLHPTATHLRYPGIYGPHQVMPLQWPIVKRALDGRRTLILADGGLQLLTEVFAENAAHAVLLAVAQGEVSSGQIYNVSDDRILTRAQVVEVIEQELDHKFEIVSLPYALARSAWPMLAHHESEHRVVDAAKIRHELGYRDVVDPIEGLRRTIRWQVQNLAGDHAQVDDRLQDPYDYAAEDELIAIHRRLVEDCSTVEFSSSPGWTIGYYGERDNPAGRAIGFRS